MLIVTFHNDGTGTPEVGNYNVEVLITTSPTTTRRLWWGRIEGFRRALGWEALIGDLRDTVL